MAKKVIKKTRKRRNTNVISDTLLNTVSGLGTRADKGAYSKFVHSVRTLDEFSAVFMSTAIARKIIEIIPGDMTRSWRNFEDSELSVEDIKTYTRAEKRFCLKSKVREALVWARLYGGALIVPILDNGDTDLIKPLDIHSIKKGQLKGFTVVDARYAHNSSVVTTDPTSINYLRPDHYTLTTTTGARIHHTRVIRFDGLILPREEFQRNRYWHQSVIDSVYKELTNATLASDSLASMLHELNLDIINIKGLSNSLAAGQEDMIKNRFEVYTLIKSMFHTVILDEDEQFSNRVMPASGSERLIDKFYGLLAAVTDIPATRFLGEAPGGLNATGDSDLRNYYDNIKDKQESLLDNNLRTLDTIISRSIWGEEKEEVHDYTWESLWQESKIETSVRELNDAERDQVYLQNGVVTEVHVASELKQNKVYSNIEPEHIKELEDMIKGMDHDHGVDSDHDDDTSPVSTSPEFKARERANVGAGLLKTGTDLKSVAQGGQRIDLPTGSVSTESKRRETITGTGQRRNTTRKRGTKR